MDVNEVKELYVKLKDNIKTVIVGKDDTIKMVLVALFAGGHVLLEEVPGSGKTTFAKTLAASINGEFKRIQLTPDLLPSDITGINFFNMKTSSFQFVEGPVFTNVLIADEINRATPKTQSGLLECMEEKQVTIDGVTYKLKTPFIVMATENPVDTQGVFPLPEAQMDRFIMRLAMSYPDHNSMVDIIRTHIKGSPLNNIEPVADVSDIENAISAVSQIEVCEEIMEYVVRLVEATRKDDRIILGVSQRGMLAIIRAAQSLAAISGRGYVIPDDVKEVFVNVVSHRIKFRNRERVNKEHEREIILEILENTAVPTENVK